MNNLLTRAELGAVLASQDLNDQTPSTARTLTTVGSEIYHRHHRQIPPDM